MGSSNQKGTVIVNRRDVGKDGIGGKVIGGEFAFMKDFTDFLGVDVAARAREDLPRGRKLLIEAGF